GGRGAGVFIGCSCASSGCVLLRCPPGLEPGAGRDLSGGVCGGRFSAARIMSCGMRSRRNVSTVTLAGVYSAPIPLALPPFQGASALLRTLGGAGGSDVQL